MGDEDASYANSILYVSSAAFSPVSGYIVDKTGRNVFWVSISIFCTIIAHGMLAFTLINPYITMVSLYFNHLLCHIWVRAYLQYVVQYVKDWLTVKCLVLNELIIIPILWNVRAPILKVQLELSFSDNILNSTWNDNSVVRDLQSCCRAATVTNNNMFARCCQFL